MIRTAVLPAIVVAALVALPAAAQTPFYQAPIDFDLAAAETGPGGEAALDVSVQAQVLNLMRSVQRRHRLSMLFISHDLSVVNYVCSRVGVLYLGRLVEIADTAEIFRRPLHPYTQALIAAIPEPTVEARPPRPLQGEIPNPLNPPVGCRFHTRCPHAVDLCRREEPLLRELRPGHLAACHLAAA